MTDHEKRVVEGPAERKARLRAAHLLVGEEMTDHEKRAVEETERRQSRLRSAQLGLYNAARSIDPDEWGSVEKVGEVTNPDRLSELEDLVDCALELLQAQRAWKYWIDPLGEGK